MLPAKLDKFYEKIQRINVHYNIHWKVREFETFCSVLLIKITSNVHFRCQSLLEIANGLFCKVHNLKANSKNYTRSYSFTHPDWNKLRQKLEKSFPDLNDVSKVSDVIRLNWYFLHPKKSYVVHWLRHFSPTCECCGGAIRLLWRCGAWGPWF